jgi:hypothetical protein
MTTLTDKSKKPRTYNRDLEHLPGALLPLTRQRIWVGWRWDWRNGRWSKPPFRVDNPSRPAKVNDPTTWGTYEDALLAVAHGKADGIGVMLKDADLLAGDLDHIRDLVTGDVAPWAEALAYEAMAAGCYVEWTVSGSGLRFLGWGRGVSVHRKFKAGTGDQAVELYRRCPRYVTISAAYFISSYDEMAMADDFFDRVHLRYQQLNEQATIPARPSLDFNDAGPQQPDLDDIIQNGVPRGQRSEMFQKVVWSLAARGWSAEQIAEELARIPNGIGAKYAGRLLDEVTRSYAKWSSRRQAGAVGITSSTAGSTATSAAVATAIPWPQILIRPGELPRIVQEAEQALLGSGREVYQRGGQVVRPVLAKSLRASANRETEAWQLVPVTLPYLVEAFGCAAQFQRYDTRKRQYTPTDPPHRVVEVYLSQQGRWKLPLLTGVVNTPFLRFDGSICETAGYDPVSGLLFKPETQVFPPVPRQPARADAIAALAQLKDLIRTFPFIAPADCSVALAAMLTVLDRRSMDTAPMFAFTSPAAGTGKSLLVDFMSVLATGRLMPVLSQGKSEEEFEKRLGAALLAGDVAISIDNCEHDLGGSLLCQIMTQRQLNVRMLGYSRNVEVATSATVFATGNNLTIVGDLCRRSLMASLDAGVERPELREFGFDVLELARKRRGELVAAALTVLRAWHVARASGESVNVAALGGFVDWSRRAREPLLWLGEADPCDTAIKVRERDSTFEYLGTVLLQWKENLGSGARYTIKDVIERAINAPLFYAALMAVAASRTGGVVSNERLGRWLKRNERKIVYGLSLRQDGQTYGNPLWKLD